MPRWLIAALPVLLILLTSPVFPSPDTSAAVIMRSAPTAAVQLLESSTDANVLVKPTLPALDRVLMHRLYANGAALSAQIHLWRQSSLRPILRELAPLPSPPPVREPTLAPAIPESSAPASVLPASEGTSSAFVPILMYHYVRTVDPDADPIGYNLSVTPEQFADQLDWLADAGYSTLHMRDIAACLSGEYVCPDRSVALTFDDGYADAYTEALPRLQAHGFVATFYVVSSFVGQPGYLGWEELRSLHDAGMEIGAHSIHHPDLTLMSEAGAYAEIAGSGSEIAAELGRPVSSFCYPAGKYNAVVAEAVRAAGYSSAVTTDQTGHQGDLFALPRWRIYGDLSLEGFTWMVTAYTDARQ